MSEEERRLTDTAGEFRYVSRDGDVVEDAEWRSCRFVLTTDRLVIATADGKKTVPLTALSVLDGEELPGPIDAGGTTPVRIGDAVLLFDATDLADFAGQLRRAIVTGAVVLAGAPAVGDDGADGEGGDSDAANGGEREDGEHEDGEDEDGEDDTDEDASDGTDWRRARMSADEGALIVEFSDGGTTSIAFDGVERVDRSRETVREEERPVLTVAFEGDDGATTVLRLCGSESHADAAAGLLSAGPVAETPDALDEDEQQVLTALYSGVSPLEVAEFVGLEIDEVESIYRDLLERGLVEEVRTRTEVELTEEGQNVASKGIGGE